MSNILTGMLESLKLETISQVYSSMAIDAEKHSKTYTDYLKDLASIEIEERRNKTIAKFLKQAKLPRDKLLKDFDITRIPNLSSSLLQNLQQGDFIDRCDNILIFGNPLLSHQQYVEEVLLFLDF